MENSCGWSQDPTPRPQAPGAVLETRIPHYDLYQEPSLVLWIKEDPYGARHREAPKPRQSTSIRMSRLRAHRCISKKEVLQQSMKGSARVICVRLPAWLVYNSTTRKTIQSRNVVFDEKLMDSTPPTHQPIPNNGNDEDEDEEPLPQPPSELPLVYQGPPAPP